MIGEEALAGLVQAIDFWRRPPDGYLETILGDFSAQAGQSVAEPQEFREWCQRVLRLAEPFYVNQEITAAILSASQMMPPLTLQPEHVPVPHGWLWFATPLRWKDGPTFSSQAIEWFPQRLDEHDPDTDIGLTVHIYSAPINDQVAMMGMSTAHFGEMIGNVDADPNTRYAAQLERILATFFLFIQQGILEMPEQRIANKGARRRLATALDRPNPAFRVVELRRIEREPSDDHRTVEWQHQWLVSGHWRRQWLPSRGTHEPRWIAPYVKGDPSKPFKPPTKRLFVVRR